MHRSSYSQALGGRETLGSKRCIRAEHEVALEQIERIWPASDFCEGREELLSLPIVASHED
jgi:hypothetical protein